MTSAGSSVSVKNETPIEVRFLEYNNNYGSKLTDFGITKVTPPPDQATEPQAASSTPKSSSKSSVKSKSSKASLQSSRGTQESADSKENSPDVSKLKVNFVACIYCQPWLHN